MFVVAVAVAVVAAVASVVVVVVEMKTMKRTKTRKTTLSDYRKTSYHYLERGTTLPNHAENPTIQSNTLWQTLPFPPPPRISTHGAQPHPRHPSCTLLPPVISSCRRTVLPHWPHKQSIPCSNSGRGRGQRVRCRRQAGARHRPSPSCCPCTKSAHFGGRPPAQSHGQHRS